MLSTVHHYKVNRRLFLRLAILCVSAVMHCCFSLFVLLFLTATPFWAAFADDAVYLTEYLNDPSLGQRKTKVVTSVYNESSGHHVSLTSYSGFITVDNSSNSNMFFWFFPALNGDTSAPILLWLQGGPGGSSMYGLFVEHGPLRVAKDFSLSLNPYTWNTKYAMLFIDNPVGAGFSFTDSSEGFSTDEFEVSENLYQALSQFFTVFSQYSRNPFYVTGESYAGKYVPATAYRIHVERKSNPGAACCNLAGFALGDGLMDPMFQFTTGFHDLFYWFGLADVNEVEMIFKYEAEMAALIAADQYELAFDIFDEFLNGDFYPYPTYFYNITGSTEYFNFLNPVYPPSYYPQYLNDRATKSLLHVGDFAFADYNATTESYLRGDFMKSVSYTLPALFDNYKALIYNGQNDLIVGPGLAENFLRNVFWKGQERFLQAKKQIWYGENSTISGYVRQAYNVTQCIVLNAGHMVPVDQPQRALDMITRFVDGNPFSS